MCTITLIKSIHFPIQFLKEKISIVLEVVNDLPTFGLNTRNPDLFHPSLSPPLTLRSPVYPAQPQGLPTKKSTRGFSLGTSFSQNFSIGRDAPIGRHTTRTSQ